MNSNQNKELSPGTTLSHYRIVSKIGAGGMSEVRLHREEKNVAGDGHANPTDWKVMKPILITPFS